MNQNYIIPFMKSVQNVFETMLQLPVQINEPTLKHENEPSYDISGIIGMNGDVNGTIVLSFPTSTAERIVSIFTGMEMDHQHEDFADAVGELVNMVSGGAKAQFTDKAVSITCPSVVIGQNHQIFGQKDLTCVQIPSESDCGEFCVEVGIRNVAVATTA